MPPLSFAQPVAAARGGQPRDFFGIVGRDPWYEYDSDPYDFPNDVNRDFLEHNVAGMAELGASWVRIEVHAQYDVPSGPGPIDFGKYDWFIQQLAPKYGLKVLLVVGTGAIGDLDKTYQFFHINDPAGATPPPTQPPSNGGGGVVLDGSTDLTTPIPGMNYYSSTYVNVVRQIADHYGDAVAAYEILNEQNANLLLDYETSGATKEVNPAIYGQIMGQIYGTVKPLHPNVQFVIGGILYDNTIPDGHLSWLTRLYQSAAVTSFKSANGRYPWDGVGFHPYFLTPDGIVTQTGRVHSLQAANGDGTGIWITEIGQAAKPPDWTGYGIMDPTAEEQSQAAFLQAVYTGLRDKTPFVDRVFWFKYEDFGDSGSYANWGLVRLRDSDFHYGPDAEPWPRKEAFAVYQSLARPDAAPTARVPSPPDLGPRVQYFQDTGHTLRDPFLAYWEQHGGLSMFGFPLTEVFNVQGRPVQYFERARFEYHAEFTGTPYVVELGLLGQYVIRGRQFPKMPPPAAPDPNRTYFSETGHYLGFGFRDYWQKNGGLAIFGYPLTEEFDEQNPADGKTYTVQYFERARFEYHPEFKGTPFEVELGLLGAQVLSSPGWYR